MKNDLTGLITKSGIAFFIKTPDSRITLDVRLSGLPSIDTGKLVIR